MSLAEKLEAIHAASGKRIPEDKRVIMNKATNDLRESGILNGVPKTGDSLAPFTLENQDGQSVSSADLLAKGTVVLTVFRGHW